MPIFAGQLDKITWLIMRREGGGAMFIPGCLNFANATAAKILRGNLLEDKASTQMYVIEQPLRRD